MQINNMSFHFLSMFSKENHYMSYHIFFATQQILNLIDGTHTHTLSLFLTDTQARARTLSLTHAHTHTHRVILLNEHTEDIGDLTHHITYFDLRQLNCFLGVCLCLCVCVCLCVCLLAFEYACVKNAEILKT